MRRLLSTLFVLVFSLVITPTANATWVDNNCFNDHADDSFYRRIDARAYADVAVKEGYEWGGGCWNDNNKDNTPDNGEGVKDGGEGPDCSGFTFKTWELMPTQGGTGFRWYNKFQDIHGPYASGEYHSPGGSGWPFHTIAKSNRLYMDAFAKDGHVGMIYTVVSSDNEDLIIEAVGYPTTPPVGKFYRDYFGQSTYNAVRREGWDPDCAPRCTVATAAEDESSGVVLVVVP